MMKVLGLDVSSSVIGVAIIEGDAKSFKRTYLGHIDLTKDDDIWKKIDHVRSFLVEKSTTAEFQNLTNIGVEEALLSFRPGASSATTITMLLRMNIVVSFLAREIFGMTPQFIPASTARKKCGLKTIMKSKCGIDIKKQVFKIMSDTDLKDVVWPTKRQSKKQILAKEIPKVQDHCYDECDAYVIARATYLLGCEKQSFIS